MKSSVVRYFCASRSVIEDIGMLAVIFGRKGSNTSKLFKRNVGGILDFDWDEIVLEFEYKVDFGAITPKIKFPRIESKEMACDN